MSRHYNSSANSQRVIAILKAICKFLVIPVIVGILGFVFQTFIKPYLPATKPIVRVQTSSALPNAFDADARTSVPPEYFATIDGEVFPATVIKKRNFNFFVGITNNDTRALSTTGIYADVVDYQPLPALESLESSAWGGPGRYIDCYAEIGKDIKEYACSITEDDEPYDYIRVDGESSESLLMHLALKDTGIYTVKIRFEYSIAGETSELSTPEVNFVAVNGWTEFLYCDR